MATAILALPIGLFLSFPFGIIYCWFIARTTSGCRAKAAVKLMAWLSFVLAAVGMWFVTPYNVYNIKNFFN